MRDLIRKRPLLIVGASVLVALLVGVGIGLTDTSAQTDLEEQIAEVDDERDDAEAELDDAEEELAQLQGELGAAQEEVRRAEDRADRASEEATAAEAATEEAPTVEAEPDAPVESDGTYTSGDFTINDVQVSEDFVGDFEVRARVTNNGGKARFVDLQATLFSGGSVVADVTALENFDAGQTRTITFTGVDNYKAWDEIEFTVDVGF